MAETFKRLDEITEADSRNLGWMMVDLKSGIRRAIGVEDVHHALGAIVLSEEAPQYIRDHFLTAKHLALYAWYVYRFHMPAQLQAYGSLEYALRERLGFADAERPPGLKALLGIAVKQGLVRQHLLRDWPGYGGTPETIPAHLGQEWLDQLPEWLSHLRNDLAHGSFTLTADSARTLRMVADIINQLFASDAG